MTTIDNHTAYTGWPSLDGIDDSGPIYRADCDSARVGHGACGLYSAIGDVNVRAALKSAETMQSRGTFGAGVMLKGVYPHRADYYAFHVLYRNRDVAKRLEQPLFIDERIGMRHFGEMEPLVKPEAYRKYDLPEMRRYFMSVPTKDEMMRDAQTSDEYQYVRRIVEKFNNKYDQDARIFSSGKNVGTFITAKALKDTIYIFDLYKYADEPITAFMAHMRWPTSIVASGIWWGAHPISFLNSSIIHNGDLSSSASNSQGLEAASVKRSVGTDSEAMLLEVENLLVGREKSLQEIEWIMCQKFPDELETMDEEERANYEKEVADPILARYKMSGPSAFVALINSYVIAGRDRDGLRQLWMGRSEDGKTVIWGSEEKVIYHSAWIAEKNFKAINCEPGRLIAYKIEDDGSIEPVFGETL